MKRSHPLAAKSKSSFFRSGNRKGSSPRTEAGSIHAPLGDRLSLLTPPARVFLTKLLEMQLLPLSSAEQFLNQPASYLAQFTSTELLGQALVECGHLTAFQLERLLSGNSHTLVIGNYRLMERLGAGAMAVVYLCEHLYMKRHAAIKVFPVEDDCPLILLERFYAEMRVLADLHHPNIVVAYDAGRLPPSGPNTPALLYLVMQHEAGGDLEDYVLKHGPVPVVQACDWIRQAARGLQAAHDHHLVHRDIKPSNLLLTERRQVKLVDFGLAREFTSRLTDPRALLGTLEFMAPEQSVDPSAVDARADIYGLGATLFWLLTGETPYPEARTVGQALALLRQTRPRRLRQLKPDLPNELDELVDRMLDPNPACRPALPLAVMNALLPFALGHKGYRACLGPDREAVARMALDPPTEPAPSGAAALAWAAGVVKTGTTPRRMLLIDDEPQFRQYVRTVLKAFDSDIVEATDGASGLALGLRERFDLVLLDLNLPDGDGFEICRKLREGTPSPHLKLIVVSGRGDPNELSEALARGADDYLCKPFQPRQLKAKVQHALRLKEAQERTDLLARELLLTNRQLEDSLNARSDDVRRAQDALLFAMAKMAESREGETPGHLRRLQQYVRQLAEALVDEPSWEGVIDQTFLEQLERCVPLHDIGKIGLPDHVLLKPGKLDEAERRLMETHTLIGDRMLEALAREHGHSLDFLGVAAAIVRHHHERYDGTGYPDRLRGDAIPAAARLVALADVYDALRRRRYHKVALSHSEAVSILLNSDGQFDPAVLHAFQRCQAEFERIYRLLPM